MQLYFSSFNDCIACKRGVCLQTLGCREKLSYNRGACATILARDAVLVAAAAGAPEALSRSSRRTKKVRMNGKKARNAKEAGRVLAYIAAVVSRASISACTCTDVSPQRIRFRAAGRRRRAAVESECERIRIH